MIAKDDSIAVLGRAILERKFDDLSKFELEKKRAHQLAGILRDCEEIYEPLLLATAYKEKWPFDWNVGFVVPHLNLDAECQAATVVQRAAPQAHVGAKIT